MLGLTSPCAPILLVRSGFPHKDGKRFGTPIDLQVPMVGVRVAPDRHLEIGLEYTLRTTGV